FWLPGEGLKTRADQDHVPYDLWRQQGHLMVSPGHTVEYEFVAEYLRGVFDRYNIKKIAFDRWNWKHFKPWLDKAGFSESEIEDKFEEFGQGYQSMSPALRDLDSVLLNSNMRHGMHPVLNMCAANAVVKADPANNRKLVKLTPKHRIDGMIALTMAVSVLARDEPDAPLISIYSRAELWQDTA
ncbi:MAG: terminase large subunit, partial [Chloroflexi bacterium]|nr:terminase large subunit [Chloroflexota bacterium]